jgi:alpha-beta hydrolase superfamily lysophospholipase
MHDRHDLRVDVTGVSGIEGPLLSAVTAHLPAEVGDETTVVFAFPGGGYARGYYDLHHDLLPGPTQAEHHVAAGLAVFACDHLGVGDSSLPEPERLSFDVLAEANHRTVTVVLEGLRAGTLVDGLSACDPARVVGVGQSMGGCLGGDVARPTPTTRHRPRRAPCS